MSESTHGSSPDHYNVLGLNKHVAVTPQQLKSAYHKALLRHHPDKAPRRDSTLPQGKQVAGPDTVSIDRLSLAYQVLSDPKLKEEYDRLLATTNFAERSTLLGKAHHAGVETVDLEDMDYDDDQQFWRRQCRCGDERAYEVTETELEGEQSHGEIYVGCKGCSLFIKVVFEAVEEEIKGPDSG
ncbi:hypothetical protein UCRPC4_g05207 [Phaeomoniella chlamydospora]|uniref:Diphthamide biosynthesis protein 4 n=1 Tax=Phaeomoniella chlamydospora TaxID=158046 RepID=A0A0G2E5L8_PHACM|nr:hypothetical protein UCRPC4_g05207 [Phaeomoniella chlamydospora]